MMRLMLLLGLAAAPARSGVCPAEQRAVLMAFYEATNGSGWASNGGWGSELDYCDPNATNPWSYQWWGVSCFGSSSGCGVISITLENHYLTGTLPSLQALAELSSLDLMGNSLSGSLSGVFTNLSKLVDIELAENRCSGTLPDEIQALPSLQIIGLDQNFVSGTVPQWLGQLTGLTDLGIGHNRLSGTIPSVLGRCTPLYNLRLGGWGTEADPRLQISGTIPHELSQLTGLSNLKLTGMKLSGTLPVVLSEMSKLSWVTANRNFISGEIPASLSRCPEMWMIIMSDNRLSGTLPSSLGVLTTALWGDGMGALDLANNRISGTIPSEIFQITSLAPLSISNNSFSGTIPSEIGQLSRSGSETPWSLEFFDNKISGTIPSEVGQITTLKYLMLHSKPPPVVHMLTLLCAGNRISGSSSASFRNLTGLTTLAISSNPIDWDLSLLDNYTSLQWAFLGNTQVRGVLPNSGASLTSSRVMLIHDCHLSGTIGEQFGRSRPNLQTLVFSNTRLSGSLPQSFGNLTDLQALLAHGMRLSGSIPASWVSKVRRSNGTRVLPNLRTLSLARNYLTGRTDVLDKAINLTTLLLNGNHLAGNVAQLDGALGLASGYFAEPQGEAMKRVGQLMQETGNPYDPFAGVNPQNFSNIALAFAGNPELTTSASLLTGSEASNLLAKDLIRQGTFGLFPGHGDYKLLCWFLIPALLLAHVLAVVISVYSQTDRWRTGPSRLLAYFYGRGIKSNTSESVLTLVFLRSQVFILILALLGCALVALNVYSDELNAQCDCGDPLTRVTISLIVPDSRYEYIWVLLAVLITTTAAGLVEWLAWGNAEHWLRVNALLRTLTSLCERHTPRSTAVQNWQRNYILDDQVTWIRSLCHFIAHIPILIAAAAPAFLFVTANNVQHSSSFWLGLCSNSLFIVVVKLLFTSFVVPPACSWLARIKYGKHAVGMQAEAVWQPKLIEYLKSRVNSSMLIQITTIVLAPMLAVFLLDEDCLRFYLLLDSELRSLLESWDIGMIGSPAYRYGFCSRELLQHFMYVWLQVLVINSLARPSIYLVLALPTTRRIGARLDDCWTRLWASITGHSMPDADHESYAQTQSAMLETQEQCVRVMATKMTVAVFGPMIPPLLLLAPLGVWLQMYARRWSAKSNTRSFGNRLADNVLVQLPIDVFRTMVLVLGTVMIVFIIVDLEFGIGPVVFFAALSLTQLIFVSWLIRHKNRSLMLHVGKAGSKSWAGFSAPEKIVFNASRREVVVFEDDELL